MSMAEALPSSPRGHRSEHNMTQCDQRIYCKVSTCTAHAAPSFWYHSHAPTHSSHVSHVPHASCILACSCHPRTLVQSPQYPLPLLACQRHLLPCLSSLFSLKLTSFCALRNIFLLGLPCLVPHALDLTDYLCTSVCILPCVSLNPPPSA